MLFLSFFVFLKDDLGVFFVLVRKFLIVYNSSHPARNLNKNLEMHL